MSGVSTRHSFLLRSLCNLSTNCELEGVPLDCVNLHPTCPVTLKFGAVRMSKSINSPVVRLEAHHLNRPETTTFISILVRLWDARLPFRGH